MNQTPAKFEYKYFNLYKGNFDSKLNSCSSKTKRF